jgi:hypothetical protein
MGFVLPPMKRLLKRKERDRYKPETHALRGGGGGSRNDPPLSQTVIRGCWGLRKVPDVAVMRKVPTSGLKPATRPYPEPD